MLLGRRGPQLPNRLHLAFKTTEPLATTFLVQFLHLEMAMNGAASANKAYTSEEYLKMTEEQLKASAAHQQEQSPQGESLSEPQTQPQDTAKETPSAVPPPQKPKN
ncbi:hypothetical protein CUMW_056930 [Citrus unshiu]|nr:hypothetical protein CUMW_056930 [Citrus unshiu]